jgi:short-chain fatty acids transporter
MEQDILSSTGRQQRGFSARIVAAFEKYMPETFSLSIILTFAVIISALVFAPKASFDNIATSWFTGVFGILAFAFQMILILATGFAIADAPPVQKLLARLASNVTSPVRAVLVIFPIVGAAAWLNWGLGLVVGAFLSREIAKRNAIDFAWLVAASYSAWSICNCGLSSSIALSQASPGNVINFTEKATGHVIGLSQTIFAPFVLVPVTIITVVMAMIFVVMHPGNPIPGNFANQTVEMETDLHDASRGGRTVAQAIEGSVLGNIALIALGFAYIVQRAVAGEFDLDINMMILLFLLAGLALQQTPKAYAAAIRRAAGHMGSMLLQYPIYGGIMGILRGTGLASAIAQGFVAVATFKTLPLLAFASSMIITFLIPSAGGHWAVDGPIVIPAAVSLHASLPHTAMAVAMAENVSNMLQPFWAIPLVAIAGVKIQRVVGFTATTFFVSLFIYALSLLFIP